MRGLPPGLQGGAIDNIAVYTTAFRKEPNI